MAQSFQIIVWQFLKKLNTDLNDSDIQEFTQVKRKHLSTQRPTYMNACKSFLFLIYFIEYSGFTMFCQFLLYGKMIQVCMFFSYSFHYGLVQGIEYSSWCHRADVQSLSHAPHSRTLFFTYSIYSSLHLLTPNFQNILPLPLLSLGNHKF